MGGQLRAVPRAQSTPAPPANVVSLEPPPPVRSMEEIGRRLQVLEDRILWEEQKMAWRERVVAWDVQSAERPQISFR